MTFLPQEPVLNKKEQDTSFKFSEEPYNKLYQNSLEGELFDGVKVKRKETSMPKLNFKPLEIKSYNQMAINKYKVGSPLAGSVQTGAGSLAAVPSIEPIALGSENWDAVAEPSSGAGSLNTSSIEAPVFNKSPSKVSDLLWKVVAFGSNPFRAEEDKVEIDDIKSGAKDVAADVASGFAWAIDIPLQQFAKGSAGSISVLWGAYYFAEEFAQSLPDLKEVVAFGSNPFRAEEDKVDVIPDPDFMKAAEKTEDLIETTEWFFGTKLTYDDYLDVRSSHEKRTEIFNSLPVEKQQKLQPLENYTLAFDVTAGILSWLGAAKAPLALANTVGRTTTLWRTMVALDTSLDAVVGQLPKLGVAYGATALAYYYQTGKWIFEWDQGATEGAAMFMMSAGLKGFGKVAGAGWEMSAGGRKYVKDMWADPEFQKGVRTYFDEAKKTFGDQIDEFATKVGARTNLLPDEKILKEVDGIRTQKVSNEISDEAFKEANDLLTKWLKSSVWKNVWIRNKLLDEGLMKEWDSLSTWLSRGFKSKVSWSFIKKQDEIFWELAWDKGTSKFLKPAQRKIATNLEQTRAAGQIGLLQNTFDKAIKKVDNLTDFNNFLFAKSRLFKVKGKDLATKVYNEDTGFLVDISEDTLNTIVKKWEVKYGTVADELYSEYDTLLQRELEAGIRTPDDIANFRKTNPFYIWDKALNVEEMLKQWPESLSINIPKKNLAQNAEQALSTDAVNNAYNEMVYRTEVLNRVEKLKLAKELSDGSELITKLGKWEKAARWNISFKLYENGKLVDYQGPKFWIKDIFTDDRLTQRAPVTTWMTAPMKYMTRLFKETQTWRLSILTGYPLIAPLFETPVAIIRMLSEAGTKKNWGRMEFFKTLFWTKGSLTADPVTAKALGDMADFLWATFTQNKQLKKEIGETLWNEFSRYSWLKSSFMRGKEAGTKVLDFIDIGNVVERKTTRIPLFSSELAKQWLDKKTLDKLVVDAQWSPTKLKKLLENQGIDTKVAAGVATNLFDYLWVSKLTNEIGQYVPYFNSGMSMAKSTKRLFESNPKLFTGLLWGWYYLASEIEKFNTNTPEKKARYEAMPEYRRNSPLLYFWVDENGDDKFVKLTRGMQFMEWTYPLYMQTKGKSDKNGFDFDDAFSQMITDSTGIAPDYKDWGKYLPTWIKQSIEYATWYSFFNRRSTITKADAKKYPTQDFSKSTSNVSLWLSRYIAVATWGKVGNDDVIRGWYQMSPRGLDKFFDTFDNWVLRGIAWNVVTNADQEWKIDTKKAFNVAQHFIKTAAPAKTTSDIYTAKESADAESAIENARIHTDINDAEVGDLKEVTKDLLKLYPLSEDKITRKLKDRVKKETFKKLMPKSADSLYLWDLVKISTMTNAQIAYNYLQIKTDKWDKAAKKLLTDLLKVGAINETKLKTIVETLVEIKVSDKILDK